jgi:hemolysin III
LVCVWGLAAVGILIKLGRMDAPRWLTVWLYLGLGWIAVVAAPVLWQALPVGGTLWFLVGGIVYSAGAVVYALKRPDPLPGVFGFHEVWHLFVLTGSACHFWAILRYVAPVA